MIAGLLSLALLHQRPSADAVCLDLTGKQVIPLNQTIAQKPAATVLIFYLAHCPISQKMTPEINRIYKEFSGKGVKFYMVHEDLTLDAKAVGKEAKEFGLLPPVLIDKWRSQMKKSGATISPEAVVYNNQFQKTYQGRISDMFYGLGKMKPKVTSRDLRQAIEDTLSGTITAPRKSPAIGCVLPR